MRSGTIGHDRVNCVRRSHTKVGVNVAARLNGPAASPLPSLKLQLSDLNAALLAENCFAAVFLAAASIAGVFAAHGPRVHW